MQQLSCFFYLISSVVGKVQCLREKRPVTPSEYGIIKEILTQRHQYSAKNVSVKSLFND